MKISAVLQSFLQLIGIKPKPLSPYAIRVMQTLYSLENKINKMNPGTDKQVVMKAVGEHHKALDELRRFHNKPMPPPKEIQLMGGPGTKPE